MTGEQDLRDGLARALSGEPPLAFDPERLIGRARRDRRRRRALAGVGTAAAVIAAIAVTVPVLLGHARPGGGVSAANAPTQVLTTTVPATADSTTAAGGAQPSRRYTAAQLQVMSLQFTQEVQVLVTKLVGPQSLVSVQPWSSGAAGGMITGGPGSLSSFARFTVQDTPTAIEVTVNAPGADAAVDAKTKCAQEGASGKECEIVSSPTGDGTLLVERVPLPPTSKAQIVSVTSFRQDGSTCTVAAYNYDPTAGTHLVYAPSVLVGVAQLTELATEGNFTFG
ncbi:MAG TPA: hypothetical protein VG756_03730 [Pseudonocardiaceae bacterium]|nr:hypothetical protein [Pseudonocardiaceae bacterium]